MIVQVPSSPDGAVTPYDGKTHVYNIDMPAYSDKVMLTFNNTVKQTTGFESGATKLKNMLRDSNELIVCPGVYDGISARVALQVGFPALYMVRFKVPWQHQLPVGKYHANLRVQTGAGTTASRLGMADLGIAQLSDMKDHAEMIANLDPYGPPLIADMDTGYGGK